MAIHPLRRDDGISSLETVVGIAILLTVIGSMAVALVFGASAGTAASGRSTVSSRIDGLMSRIATQPFLQLASGDVSVPTPCEDDAAASCVLLGAGEVEIVWTFSSELANVPGPDGATSFVDITGTAALPDGTVVTRSQRVIAPVFGDVGDNSAIVRVTLVEGRTVAGAELPGVYVVDAAGAVVAGAVSFGTGGQAILRVPDATICTPAAPCRVALDPDGTTPTAAGGYTLTAVDSFAQATALSLTPQTITDLSVAVRPTRTATVHVAAEDANAALDPFWTDVAAGSAHTCGRLSSGDIYCWGSNSDGQFGDGTTTSTATPTRSLVDGGGDLSAADTYTCAGDICFGASPLGSGTQVTEPPRGETISVDAGRSHVCWAESTGTVSCAGSNAHGQLGIGTVGGSTSTRGPATALPSNIKATAVTVGDRHTCITTRTDDVYCWGDGPANGDAGVGDTGTPQLALSDVVGPVDAGWRHTCAWAVSAVQCWGDSTFGQAGTPTGQADSPRFVVGDKFQFLGSGGADHTCAITSNSDTLQCWGRNQAGQSGGGFTGQSGTPTDVPGFTCDRSADPACPALWEVSAGGQHTCVRYESRNVEQQIACFGSNASGQLGPDAPASSLTPVVVPAPDAVPVTPDGFGELVGPGPETGGSICVWATFDDGLELRTQPYCTTSAQPDRITISSYTATIGPTDIELPLPEGMPVLVSVDRPDAPLPPTNPAATDDVESAAVPCPHIDGQTIYRDGDYVPADANTGECTSWTWGHPTHVFYGTPADSPIALGDVLTVDSDPADPAALWPGLVTVNSPGIPVNDITLVWADPDGGPAEGATDLDLRWAKPFAARACADGAACTAPALDRAAFTSTCTGQAPFTCSELNLPPQVVTPASLAERIGASPDAFTVEFADLEDANATMEIVALPAHGTLEVFDQDLERFVPVAVEDRFDGRPNRRAVDFLYTYSGDIPAGNHLQVQLTDSAGNAADRCVFLHDDVYPARFDTLGNVAACPQPDADPDNGTAVTVAQGETASAARSVVAQLLTITGEVAVDADVTFSAAPGSAQLLPNPVTVQTDDAGQARLELEAVRSCTDPQPTPCVQAGTYTLVASNSTVDRDLQIDVTVLPTLDPSRFTVTTPTAITLAQGDSAPVEVEALDLSGDPINGLVVRGSTNDADRRVVPSTTTCVTSDGECALAVTARFDAAPTVNPSNPPVTFDVRSGSIGPAPARQVAVTVISTAATVVADPVTVAHGDTVPVAVRVADAAGNPTDAAAVTTTLDTAGSGATLTFPPGGTSGGQATGTLTVPTSEPAGPVRFTITADGAQTTFVATVTAETDEIDVITPPGQLYLGRSTSMVIEVTDRDGQPIQGAPISVAGALPRGIQAQSGAATDASGRATVHLAAARDAQVPTPASQTLSVQTTTSTGTVLTEAFTLTIVDSDVFVTLTGSLESDGTNPVTLRASDRAGQPLANLELAIGTFQTAAGTAAGGFTPSVASVTTNSSGRATLDITTANVAAGSYQAAVTFPGGEFNGAATVPVQVTGRPADITVVANPMIRQGSTGTVAVEVLDDDGNPVVGASVSGTLPGLNGTSVVAPAATGPDGIARVRVGIVDEPAGTYDFTATVARAGAAPLTDTDIVVVAAGIGSVDVTGTAIAAGTTGPVTVTVTDLARPAAPAANLSVQIRPPSGALTASASTLTTNGAGQVTVDVTVAPSTPPGRYLLGLTINGRPFSATVEVP